MTDVPSALEGWPAIIAGIMAGAAALIVPLNGFIKTLLDYRLEARKAGAFIPDTARDVASAGAVLFDSMAIADLTLAIKGLTSAIAADTASEEAHHASQIGTTMARLTETLERIEAARPAQHGRR